MTLGKTRRGRRSRCRDARGGAVGDPPWRQAVSPERSRRAVMADEGAEQDLVEQGSPVQGHFAKAYQDAEEGEFATAFNNAEQADEAVNEDPCKAEPCKEEPVWEPVRTEPCNTPLCEEPCSEPEAMWEEVPCASTEYPHTVPSVMEEPSEESGLMKEEPFAEGSDEPLGLVTICGGEIADVPGKAEPVDVLDTEEPTKAATEDPYMVPEELT